MKVLLDGLGEEQAEDASAEDEHTVITILDAISNWYGKIEAGKDVANGKPTIGIGMAVIRCPIVKSSVGLAIA